MKTLRMTLAVAGLFLAGSLFAQQGVQAKVPFSFYVGNSELMPTSLVVARVSRVVPK